MGERGRGLQGLGECDPCLRLMFQWLGPWVSASVEVKFQVLWRLRWMHPKRFQLCWKSCFEYRGREFQALQCMQATFSRLVSGCPTETWTFKVVPKSSATAVEALKERRQGLREKEEGWAECFTAWVWRLHLQMSFGGPHLLEEGTVFT